MDNKFSKKELLKIADSGLANLSCEQIKQLIKKESEKDYENINTDFIDLCFDVLAMKQGNHSFASTKLQTKKKVTAKKVLLFAAVFMIFVVTTLTVSANVFHFNIPKEISLLIKGNAQTDTNFEFADTMADGYLLENSELAQNLKTQGVTPVTLPEALIKETCTINKVDNITADKSISADILIEFQFNNSFGKMIVSQHTYDLQWTGEIVDMDVLSADMIKVNGMDVLIFERENSCTIRYKDRQTTYDIYLETDFETAKLFAQTIK